MSAKESARPPLASRPSIAWRDGPIEPGPVDSAVDVWRAQLGNIGPALAGLLSHEERERARRISRPPQRELWQRSRGLLRVLLARYVHAEPRELRITVGEHGKPELADTNIRLWFNLSHSGDLALYAISADGPVGVDVQRARDSAARDQRDYVALAERFFRAEDARHLAELHPDHREREFLRLWTRHEAELKRRGTGLPGSAIDTGEARWIAEIDVGARAAAALACSCAPRGLRLWYWR